MTERYTSGSVGRFDFKTANRLADAADRVESLQQAPANFSKVTPRRAVVARLTIPYNVLQFSPEPGMPNRQLMAWDWEEMAVIEDSSPLLRRSLAYRGGLRAADYDNMTRGIAVCVDGESAAGDIVLLQPITNEQTYDPHAQEKWYAFQGARKYNSTVLLAINSAAAYGTRRWKYTVAPLTLDKNGDQQPDPNGYPAGVAWNTYELNPFGHNQLVTFTSPPGSLTVNAVQGVVCGVFLARDGTAGVYAFEAVNPMTPNCT